uniref:ATP-binding cassette domain-containing protein n=1 Tax=candidate division WOR-3 bacterium TaxID=2052148 RepID=A0A7C4CCF9_UNCW3
MTRSYGSLRALDGISFAVAAGEVFGLIGPNGSGKTTTLRITATLLSPSGARAATKRAAGRKPPRRNCLSGVNR